LIEFTENTDIDAAKKTIDEFFQKKEISDIDTKILKQLLLDNKQIKMIFQNNEQKKLKLAL
jgi:tmRNA-binding protein